MKRHAVYYFSPLFIRTCHICYFDFLSLICIKVWSALKAFSRTSTREGTIILKSWWFFRPLAFESSFSVNRRNYDLLAISPHFVWISSKSFSFLNVSHKSFSFITWNLTEYLHIQDFQRATAYLNVWTNILLLCFVYGCKQHTKMSKRNRKGGNLSFTLRSPPHFKPFLLT